MFNLSGSEIIVILLLALVVLGPEKLPDALRRAGRTYAELKKMGNSFQDEMRSVIDEPVKEMRETADLLRSQASFPDVDPKKPGSGGRAAGQLPAATTAAAAAKPALPSATGESAAEVTHPADDDRSAADGDGAATSAAGEDDEALINRTLSGRTGPPAGDAAL
ncbi:MAG: twin-arginine translocase TatA/TatE family subunit [Ilumatobacteraceae bacterium]